MKSPPTDGSNKPHVLILAGPNGAGKTTASRSALSHSWNVQEFVNADIIAEGLTGLGEAEAAIRAGRIMLNRLDELAEQRATFAFETTLSTRSFAPWLRKIAKEFGYARHLFYFWIWDPEECVKRVARRVEVGGHFVPDDVVRRRHDRGIRNFFDLYANESDSWMLFDNTDQKAVLIASGGTGCSTDIEDLAKWNRLEKYRTK